MCCVRLLSCKNQFGHAYASRIYSVRIWQEQEVLLKVTGEDRGQECTKATHTLEESWRYQVLVYVADKYAICHITLRPPSGQFSKVYLL